MIIHSWNGEWIQQVLVMSPIEVRARIKEVKALVRESKCIYRGVPYTAKVLVPEYFGKKI